MQAVMESMQQEIAALKSKLSTTEANLAAKTADIELLREQLRDLRDIARDANIAKDKLQYHVEVLESQLRNNQPKPSMPEQEKDAEIAKKDLEIAAKDALLEKYVRLRGPLSPDTPENVNVNYEQNQVTMFWERIRQFKKEHDDIVGLIPSAHIQKTCKQKFRDVVYAHKHLYNAVEEYEKALEAKDAGRCTFQYLVERVASLKAQVKHLRKVLSGGAQTVTAGHKPLLKETSGAFNAFLSSSSTVRNTKNVNRFHEVFKDVFSIMLPRELVIAHDTPGNYNHTYVAYNHIIGHLQRGMEDWSCRESFGQKVSGVFGAFSFNSISELDAEIKKTLGLDFLE